ncbi:MAG: radical SAM protein [Desulfobacteraceae bacterium]|nr:radical SAM protein [Desulfobacteraceae bacterium]
MKSRTVSFSKNSTNIFFHILTQCNLKCRHCYINPEQQGKNSLPLPLIEAWLSVFVENPPELSNNIKEANVIFLGGEPTLHPDLPQAVKKAKELGYRSVTIDTNGYLFNDILSKVEPNQVDFFSFSLDGATGQTNDMIRGRGSYDKCTSGIKKAISRGFNTSLIYTISRDNIHELDMMPPLLKDLGINRFFIQVIGLRGKAAHSDTSVRQPSDMYSATNLQSSRKEWMQIVPRAAKKVAELGITVTYPKVFLSDKEPFECAALVADNYFIFPNARVYRCPLCEDFPFHSMAFHENRLIRTPRINESDLFALDIPEGCVMNRLIQPYNLIYRNDGTPEYKIACCMLKEEICV